MVLHGTAAKAEMTRGFQHMTVIAPDFGESFVLSGREVKGIARAKKDCRRKSCGDSFHRSQDVFRKRNQLDDSA
jgi:hypothetical protein